MKRLKQYNDFLFDSLLEASKEGELPFRLSNRLQILLKKIDHTISTKLLEDGTNGDKSKVTLIDYDDTKEDSFTFATSAKLLDYIAGKSMVDDNTTNLNYFNRRAVDNNNPLWTENRATIKVGRFINKIYPNVFKPNGKPGEDIESFVEKIKSERTKYFGNFKIVQGEDVRKYYLEDNYEDNNYGSTLGGSCMKYDNCQPYISFYVDNNIKLLILMSEEQDDKIIGRAIVWNISEIDGEEVERQFMDRIYYVKMQDVEKFKEFAKKNGWLHKDEQDMWSETEIVDTKDGSRQRRTMLVKNIKESVAYPYTDTMKYFDTTAGTLTNDEDADYDWKLESADGGYYNEDGNECVYDEDSGRILDEDEMIWSDTEDRHIPADDAVYSENLSEWVSQGYAEDHWTYSDKEDDWFDNDDIVYISSEDIYVSIGYADENYVQCSYDDEYYSYDDGVPSDEYGIVPHEHAIIVITDEDVDLDEIEDVDDLDLGSDTDARWKGDDTYFHIFDEVRDKDWYFSNDLKGSELVQQLKG